MVLSKALTLFFFVEWCMYCGLSNLDPLYCDICVEQSSVHCLFTYFIYALLVLPGFINLCWGRLCAAQFAAIGNEGNTRTMLQWCTSPSGKLQNGKSFVFIFSSVISYYLSGFCTDNVWILLANCMPIPTVRAV